MRSPAGRGGDPATQTLSLNRGVGRLPLTVSFLFLLATFLWILFEHRFLDGWEPVTKDLFWALMSTWVLYLLLRYGVSVIRRSEGAQREIQERLSRILETSASGILVVDPKGHFVFANPAAAALLGTSRADLIGRHFTDRPWGIPGVDGGPDPSGDLPFSLVDRTGEALYGAELSLTRRDGSRVVLSVNTVPLHDPDGNTAGMIASFFDITERREAEDLKLRKLHLAVEQSPNAVAITDAEGRIEYANPVFLRMEGYPREALLSGKTSLPAGVPPPDGERIRDAIAAGTEWKGEYRNRRESGGWYWEAAVLTPIRNAEGAVANFLWVARDITDRRLAAEALREGRERYQNLVEKIHDLVWETDRDAAFTYVSPRVRDLLGYEPGEVLGKSPFDLMPEDEAGRVADQVAPVIAGRGPFEHIETVFRSRDGRLLHFTTSGVPAYSADGEFLGWRGVSRDVTRLKKDEEALRRNEERFRQIFEQNEEPVFLFRSGSTRILDANPAALALYGYTLEELRAGGSSLLVPPGERFQFGGEIRGIRPENPLSIPEARHLRKDGTPIIVSIRGKSIQLQGEQVSYCTFRDITARVRAEEEARARQAQLIHANRMTSLGTMISGVAHEINNPNNLIMFNAPMVLAAWADAEKVLDSHFRANGEFPIGGLPYSEMREAVPRLIEGMSDSSARIRGIVEKLKNFARRGRENLDCRIDLNEVVRAAVSILNHEIVRRCDNFRTDLAENLPTVKGCAQQLEQVMINLLMNSLQSLPDRTKGIRIITGVHGETGMVQVDVSDEGEGIRPEAMSRLTEPFFSTKLDCGGLGLGLSISSSIIGAHRGTLDFVSEVGRGTTARITLPPIDSAAKDYPRVSDPAVFQ